LVSWLHKLWRLTGRRSATFKNNNYTYSHRQVYITGRTKEKLDTVTKTYGQNISGQIIPITADITDKKDIITLYDEISSKEKHLDILINNAGISTATFNTEASSAEEMKKNMFEQEDATFKDWDDVYRTNVSQIYFMTTAFLPLLQKLHSSVQLGCPTLIYRQFTLF